MLCDCGKCTAVRNDMSTFLHNLLARIHRDGGHYTATHGLDKSVKDADQIVANLYVERDALQSRLDNQASSITSLQAQLDIRSKHSKNRTKDDTYAALLADYGDAMRAWEVHQDENEELHARLDALLASTVQEPAAVYAVVKTEQVDPPSVAPAPTQRTCPRCGSSKIWKLDIGDLQCGGCGKHFAPHTAQVVPDPSVLAPAPKCPYCLGTPPYGFLCKEHYNERYMTVQGPPADMTVYDCRVEPGWGVTCNRGTHGCGIVHPEPAPIPGNQWLANALAKLSRCMRAELVELHWFECAALRVELERLREKCGEK